MGYIFYIIYSLNQLIKQILLTRKPLVLNILRVWQEF
jgi:hypothetical protein